MSAEQNMAQGTLTRLAYGERGDVIHQEATIQQVLSGLQNTAFLPATSASATVVIMGKLIANPTVSVFLKIFKDEPEDAIFAPLRCEYKIYSELYKLRQLGVTPNLLARVATYRLTPQINEDVDDESEDEDDIIFYSDPSIVEISNYREYMLALDSEWEKIPDKIPRFVSLPGLTKWRHTLCIMTCTVEHSLLDCLYFTGDKAPTTGDIVGILYQIVHLLTWFEHVEMAHHDLHPGNIRVEYHAAPIDIYYQHKEDECVCVSTRFIVKIYDFDHSTIYKRTDLGRGKVVEPVENKVWGFHTFNPKEDCYKILIHILKVIHSKSPRLQMLLNLLIPGLYDETTLKYVPEYKYFLDHMFDDMSAISPQKNILDYSHYLNCMPDPTHDALMEALFETFFMEYFNVNLNPYHIITFPPDNTFSKCSMYIPDSIMLTNLQMLDVLSSSFVSSLEASKRADIDRAIRVVSVQDARNSRNRLYPTPNIYYAAAANTGNAATSAKAKNTRAAMAPPVY